MIKFQKILTIFFGVLLFMLAAFSGVNSANAAAISWDGDAADGEWETATNWSGDVLPGAADDVTIDMSETIAINGTTTINSLTLGNVNSPVLNFDYDAITSGALIIDDGNLTVGSNADVTHTRNGTARNYTIYIDVQTGSADIDGSIDVEAQGFAKNYGTGAGGSWGGGGYGGYGGGVNGGTTYGSITAPVDIGSGSGNGTSNSSYGGGAIRLTVAGTLDVDAAAVISADGSDNLSWYGSGASGGSVYLDVGTLSGSGIIRADGGGTEEYYASGGGGGRIAIYYDIDSSSIVPTAYGGKKGADSRINFGGAGTIYMKDNAQSYGDMLIDNNSYHNNSDYELGKTPLSTATYKTITLSNNGHLVLESGATLTYTTLTWTGGEITDDGGSLATVTSGDAVVPTGSYLYANTARTGGSALTSLTINGTVLHSQNIATQTYSIDLETTGNTTIGASGSINVDYLGFTANNGPCPGVNSGDDGGAGNGGQGGNGGGGAGGDVCGTLADSTDVATAIINPDLAGSGGGAVGGTGGGVVKLVVGGTFSHAGDITADASNAGTSGGGAAGGSIWIDAGTISGAGTIGANGSVGYNNAHGDGGGGRIAIYYDTDSSSSYTLTAYGGQKAADTKRFGGAGTIYIKDNGESYGDLTIDNNGYTDTDDRFHGRTVLAQDGVAKSYNFNTLTISNDGYLDVTSDSTIVATTTTWTGGIIADNGGTFASVLTGNITVPSGARLLANTTRSITSLTVNGTLSHSTNNTTQDYVIDYTVSGNVTIDAAGSIDVQGMGYATGQGPGAGADGGGWGSGAGHAGAGGDSADGGGLEGAVYDTIDSPDTIGSGGGPDGSYTAPNGGGAVKLVVGGNIVIGGDINADAGTTGVWFDWGGSSGGSVWLDVSGACSGAGNISADGSSGHSNSAGAGAGGYIRMICGSSTWSGTPTVIAGTTGQAAEAGVSLINLPPTVGSVTATQSAAGDGDVIITFEVDDANNDDTIQVKIEYSINGGAPWLDPTLSTIDSETTASVSGDPSIDNNAVYQVGQAGSYIETSSGANTISVVWESATDIPSSTEISNAQLKITPYDSYASGTTTNSPTFTLDVVAPTGLADLLNTAAADTSMTFTWTAASDANFDHYEIWYGTELADVQGRTGTAAEWDNGDDANLATATTATTTITGANLGNKYYKIWAVDTSGNEQTVTQVFVALGGSQSPNVYAPTNITVEDYSGGGIKLSWDDPTEGEMDYIQIFRGIDPYSINGTPITKVLIGIGYYIDKDVEIGDVVTYKLKTKDGDVSSNYSEAITFTVGSTLSSDDGTSEEDSSTEEDTSEEDTVTGDTGGSSGGGGGSSSNNDEDEEEDEDEQGSSLDDLGISVPDHWSEGYLKNLGEEDRVIEEAVQTTSFFEMLMDMFADPNKGMNRGEALQFLLTLADYTATESAVNSFDDVTADHERGYLIEFAADNGLVQGYPDGTFRPEEVVNRAEALKMAAYFFGLDAEELYGEELLEHYGLFDNPFVDVDIEAWYAPHVIFAYANGVVQGYQDGTHRFGPENEVTYAEFVKIATLMRDFENAVELASELE